MTSEFPSKQRVDEALRNGTLFASATDLQILSNDELAEIFEDLLADMDVRSPFFWLGMETLSRLRK